MNDCEWEPVNSLKLKKKRNDVNDRRLENISGDFHIVYKAGLKDPHFFTNEQEGKSRH